MLRTVIIAHATGFTWDEALLVMAPIAAIAGVVLLVNSRVNKLRGDRPEHREHHEADEDPRRDVT